MNSTFVSLFISFAEQKKEQELPSWIWHGTESELNSSHSGPIEWNQEKSTHMRCDYMIENRKQTV